MVTAKQKFDSDFFSWCNLRLKFGKITPDSPWLSDGRLVTTILFSGLWRQKQNLVKWESSPISIYLFNYVPTTHLATLFYKKMEQICKGERRVWEWRSEKTNIIWLSRSQEAQAKFLIVSNDCNYKALYGKKKYRAFSHNPKRHKRQ